MKKTIFKIALSTVLLASLMFAEYRVIMHNLEPRVSGNCIVVEVFGQADYYANEGSPLVDLKEKR